VTDHEHPQPDHPSAEGEHPHPSQHRPVDHDTPAAPTDGRPSKRHGDPLLAASKGETEGTEGSRQGHHEPDA
jgi:hypothetical protein